MREDRQTSPKTTANEVIGKGLEDIEQDRQQKLEKMIQTYVLDSALQWQELQRLRRQLGERHPRVRRLEIGIERTSSLVHNLQVQLEIARIRVPEAPDEGTLVLGRVMDDSGRGYEGLIVFGQDENCEPLCAFGTATTDVSGYYLITVDAELLKFCKQAKIFLAVKTKGDKILHRQKAPLRLKANTRELNEIVLKRRTIWPKSS